MIKKQHTTYWLCQLAGWIGMVLIELSNYTFFIVGSFDVAFLYQFGSSALIGLIVTHGYRNFLHRRGYFSRPHKGIWIFALISTVVLATIITLTGYGISLAFAPSGSWRQIRAIDFLGSVYNWCRYVGVWVIIYFMYKLLQHNYTMEQERLRIERNTKSAELELLKTQLNPHFLFNALNSIKALVSLNPELSRDAIVKLSELLRFTLQYSKEQEIPVQQELDEVLKYLSLEQLRFGERLLVRCTTAKDAAACMIPPAMLLTLAENAVKHGISASAKQGEIGIAATCEANLLVVRMQNTGSYEPGIEVGIGLRHITRRLEELYGGQAVFTIENKTPYVVATLKIPQKNAYSQFTD